MSQGIGKWSGMPFPSLVTGFHFAEVRLDRWLVALGWFFNASLGTSGLRPIPRRHLSKPWKPYNWISLCCTQVASWEKTGQTMKGTTETYNRSTGQPKWILHVLTCPRRSECLPPGPLQTSPFQDASTCEISLLSYILAITPQGFGCLNYANKNQFHGSRE